MRRYPTGRLPSCRLPSFQFRTRKPNLLRSALHFSGFHPWLGPQNTTSSDIRCFASTLPAKASLPSPQRVILNTLEHLKHDKWGFVIYRCTYQDDKAWTRFKQIVFENTQNEMQRSDAPEVADKLEWTFVEDRAALDGASRSQLRERFKQWAAQAIIAEQPRAQAQAQEDSLFGIPRYNYFIQIDEEALQSVLAAPRNDPSGEGFVNFVDARWNPLGDIYPEDEDERYDPIDECTEENVGWMRIATMMIDTEWYDAAINFASGGWFVYYLRPPKIVLYLSPYLARRLTLHLCCSKLYSIFRIALLIPINSIWPSSPRRLSCVSSSARICLTNRM